MMRAREDTQREVRVVDDEQLERMAGGRVWAPTGAMRYVAMVLIAVVIVLAMIGMAWLTIS